MDDQTACEELEVVEEPREVLAGHRPRRDPSFVTRTEGVASQFDDRRGTAQTSTDLGGQLETDAAEGSAEQVRHQVISPAAAPSPVEAVQLGCKRLAKRL